MIDTIATIGAGQAAAVAVRTLRRRGFDGRIELIGAEPHLPYQRPPLSKEYLAGGSSDGLFLLTEQWCERNGVTPRLGVPAERVHGGAVELADGTRVPADAVLVVPGSRPRRLPGVHGERVLYLRTVEDADRLREHLRPGAHLAIIGAGFVGSEVASTARARGARVTVVEALEVPLRRQLGTRMGEVCAGLHRRNGVDLRCGEAVEKVQEAPGGVTVTTTRGRVDADAVLVAVGVEPEVGVALRSGLEVDNGIVVDENCRTSVPAVFAAGDVANRHHPLYGRRMRVEHFDTASRQAVVAANAMLGRAATFAEPHWFWSDQFGVSLQYVGHAAAGDELVVRGRVENLDFSAFYLRDGRVRAAFAVDRGADVAVARELVAGRVRVDARALRDEDVDLADLLDLAEATPDPPAGAPAATAATGPLDHAERA